MSADDERNIIVKRLVIARNGREVVSENVVAYVPAKNGTYTTKTGEPITVVLDRINANRRGEKAVDIQLGDGPLRAVSIGRKTGVGRIRDPFGQTAIEIAITDPSVLRPNRKAPLGQAPQRVNK